MLCEKCKKRTATVFYNENINGKTQSYSLCGDCAAKLREKGDLQDITSMMDGFSDPFSSLQSDLFGGFFGMPILKAVSAEKKCPSCGCLYSDISKSGKVGCPTCYEIFRDELSRTLRSVHGTTTHIGSVPSRQRAMQERAEKMNQLRQQIQEAIEQEDYEKAAGLRDEIRSLESDHEKKEDA